MAPALRNIGELWQRTDLVQRVLLVGVLVAFAIGAAFLVRWVREPKMGLLYSDLDPAEAAKIVEKIRDDDIPHKLADGGRTVYVSEKEVYSLRLLMASQSLPSGSHAGYKILDKEQFGASPYLQKVNHIRAIEGELAKSVQTLEGVTSARVHVAPGESGLFGAKHSKATASVVLRLAKGWRPTGQNVAAITHLVAGGVEGLAANDVTVIDSEGNKLSRAKDGHLSGSGGGGVIDLRASEEARLARKIEDLLTPVLGPGRVSVRVAAKLTTESVTKETKEVSKGAEVESQTTRTTSSSPGAAGKAGTQNETESEQVTNIPSERVSRIVQLPGEVTSISVSCLVDLTGPEKEEGQEEAATPTMTAENVEDLIRNALGLKETDALKVITTRFHDPQSDTSATTEAEAGMFTKDFILDMAKRFSLGILVIGALLALKILRKSSKKAVVAAGVEGEVQQPQHLLTAAAGGASRDALRDQITRALQDNPDEVKRLFLSWVEGDQGET